MKENETRDQRLAAEMRWGDRARAIDISVGRRITLRRRHLGYSASEAASSAHITEDRLRRIEAGTERAGPVLLDLAGTLGVKISYFFEDAA